MRFVLDPPDGGVLEWDPHAPPADLRPDTRYWSEAFRALPRVADGTVVLTWSTRELPVYGHDVAAVGLADEASRRPAYADRIGALFKCYGDRPRVLPPRPTKLGISVFLQELRRRLESLGDSREGPVAHPVPLGLVRPLDIEVGPMAERDIDVAFMGSV